MAISKAKKTEKVQLLAKELETSTTAIIGTFSKLTVAKDFELRKVIREAGGKYRVVKNKLAAVSGKGTQVEAALKGLKGVNSVAFTAGDPVALAKVFAKWAGENRGVPVQAGHCGRQAAERGRSEGAGDDAGQGRAVLEAAVPHQCSGAASGYGAQCHGPRPGGGSGPGRGERKVCRRRSKLSAFSFSFSVEAKLSVLDRRLKLAAEAKLFSRFWPWSRREVRGSGASETSSLGAFGQAG